MSATELQVTRVVQAGRRLLLLALRGSRRSWPLGHLDLETGAAFPMPGVDTHYLGAVLEASGTSVSKLLREYVDQDLHEPDAHQVFPDFPHTQVRAVGGRLVPAIYRLIFTARPEQGGRSWTACYLITSASAAGIFRPAGEAPSSVPLGETLTILEAQYLALIAALAALVSQVRRNQAQPAACVCDIWTDCRELVVRMADETAQIEDLVGEHHALARRYLRLFAATRLRDHAPVYSLMTFDSAELTRQLLLYQWVVKQMQ